MHQYLPGHFRDPFGLFARLVKSRDSAAWFAMVSTVLGILATPLDMLLENYERKKYDSAGDPSLPIIIVCGPPRSGTTLAEQVLINNLPVAYINNLTSIFPRSPITANWLFDGFMQKKGVFPYHSYYGKSTKFSGPNDALYLWDRWFGSDRTIVPDSLDENKGREMVQFFGAFEQFYNQPIVTKNNSLNTYASLVADVLQNSYFVCMNRDPVYLAQSLLRARQDIHGDLSTPYGVDEVADSTCEDFIEDVCRQVRFYNRKMLDQLHIIGEERFWIVPYELFCSKPEELIRRVAEGILQVPFSGASLPPFKNANRVRINPDQFSRIEQELSDLQVDYYGP